MLEYDDSLLTVEDYEFFKNDGKRHEIIGGTHIMTPAPGTKHQNIVRILTAKLSNYLDSVKTGIIFVSPIDVVISRFDVVQPDIVYIGRERKSIITEKNIQGVPDLIVEILSESSLKEDKLIKRKLYEKCGVEEYWIIDPFDDSVVIYTRMGDRLKKALEFEDGDSLESPRFPGFILSLPELFAPFE